MEASVTGGVGILVVDDESSIRKSLKIYLSQCGYRVEIFGDGASALEAFRTERRPLILTDLMMPGISGQDLLHKVKAIDATAEVIVMTGYATIDGAVNAIKAGAYDFIVKPFKMNTILGVLDKALSHRALVRENLKLQENSLNVLRAMVNVLEERDAYTAGHSQRVTEFAVATASAAGLSEDELKILRLAGPIHDIGKIGIDDHILRKPDRLTESEYDIIKSHPEKGSRIIEPLEFLRETIPLILYHHERYDGAGYPAGLSGADVPLGARILTVADTFDAMTSSRAYRAARCREEAFEELRRCSGSQFDPELVDIFIDLCKSGIIAATAEGKTAPGPGPHRHRTEEA